MNNNNNNNNNSNSSSNNKRKRPAPPSTDIRSAKLWLKNDDEKTFVPVNNSQKINLKEGNWTDAIYNNIACKKRKLNNNRVCTIHNQYIYPSIRLQKPKST